MRLHTQINIITILLTIITVNLNFNYVGLIMRKTRVETDYVYTNIVLYYIQYTPSNAEISSSFVVKSIILSCVDGIPIIIKYSRSKKQQIITALNIIL